MGWSTIVRTYWSYTVWNKSSIHTSKATIRTIVYSRSISKTNNSTKYIAVFKSTSSIVIFNTTSKVGYKFRITYSSHGSFHPSFDFFCCIIFLWYLDIVYPFLEFISHKLNSIMEGSGIRRRKVLMYMRSYYLIGILYILYTFKSRFPILQYWI